MAHKHEDIFENRKEFQIERMILFSDAVFAIAITLLVLDLRIPEEAVSSDPAVAASQALEGMAKITGPVIGFIASFFIIGQYWVTHHRLFGFVNNFDSGLVWLNLLSLFWIVLVPFSTSLNFHYGTVATWVVYSVNLSMVSLFIYFIWKRISNPKRNLTWLLTDPVRLRYGRIRSMVVTIIFLSGLICLLPVPHALDIARYLFVLIFPAMKIVGHRYKKAEARHREYLAAHPAPRH